MNAQSADWTIVQPGTIQLATTQIFIVLSHDGYYEVKRNGLQTWTVMTLRTAKEIAMEQVNELLLMGMEP